MSEAVDRELSETKKECIRQAARALEAERTLKNLRHSFGSIVVLVRSCECLCRDTPAGKLSLLLEGPLAAMKQIAEEGSRE